MYRFQIRAQTQAGETIGLVGSTRELGMWDVANCVRLRTSNDRYPLWWIDQEIEIPTVDPTSQPRIEYKYVRLRANRRAQWEALGLNRWVPIAAESVGNTLIVDDGAFGYLQPYPYGYLETPVVQKTYTDQPQGLKIVVIGSSVAVGCNAWLNQGWAWHLAQAVQQNYGHQLVNVSEVGANVSTTIDRFPLVVTPEQPDVVIIALSLGNEGLAYCAPHERRAVQRRFESGLKQLVKMTRELKARPILAGLYPNGDYLPEHDWLLRDTHQRMLRWGVPVLDWFAAVEDGQGRWQTGISFDPAHPNTIGHRRMYEAIDLRLFQIDKDELAAEKERYQQKQEVPIYRDNWGFHVFACPEEKHLRIINTSQYPYTIAPDWHALQTSLQYRANLLPGIYIAQNAPSGTLSFFAVRSDGMIETTVQIPPATDLEYSPAFNFFSPTISQILFYDGQLGILKEGDRRLRIINESDHEYNIQPMWKEVRSALKPLTSGVYHDPLHPDAPFRTLMIGNEGLESRVKAPPKSSMLLEYKCKLSDISRVAIIPLGDRCAVRMMLYKMEYDGPAYPFDLTRTTNLGDVADMIETRFYDIWNPAYLHYDADASRIYHTKWTGLSFAHEVEESDNPTQDMTTVHERMRLRYSARSNRFWYTLQHCDKALFVRTGVTDRGAVIDLMHKLAHKCQGKPFRLLLLSPQSSDEFNDLPDVLHYDVEFNPDRMYADLGHWLYCTDVMRGILESLGVSSQNLFWCPPNPPQTNPPV